MRVLYTAALITCLVVPAAHADMAPFWQGQREVSNALSTRACGGDEEAYFALRKRAFDEGNPTAKVSLAWLTTNGNCGGYFTGNEENATDLYLDAAEAGYPLAMGAVGMRLIIGRGMEPSAEEGLKFAEKALQMGYGDVGAHVAQEHITGRHLARDKDQALQWLAKAETAGTRAALLDETRMMLEQEFGSNEWLPPLSGTGFQQVGDKCVLHDDVMTLVAVKGMGQDRPSVIGITDDGWNYANSVGQELADTELTVQVNLFDGGPRFKGVPRVGSPDTLVVRIGPDKMQALWERWDNKCQWDTAASETVYYKLGDAGSIYFDAGSFFQPTVWSQFKSCAGIYFLNSFGECQ